VRGIERTIHARALSAIRERVRGRAADALTDGGQSS